MSAVGHFRPICASRAKSASLAADMRQFGEVPVPDMVPSTGWRGARHPRPRRFCSPRLSSSLSEPNLPFMEDSMARLLALLVAVYCFFQSGFVFADAASKQLVGSWKLTSWTIQIVGGDASEPFGPNPKGRALFTPDGYAAFII